MDDKSKPDFELQSMNVHDLSPENLSIIADDKEVTALGLAIRLMNEYEPSIAVVCSPHMKLTPRGFQYPLEIGISVNHNLGITKSVAAAILREIADMLDEDINKVMAFVEEATGND